MKGYLTPCTGCRRVVFCGSACSSNARKTWHRDECLDVSGSPLEPALSGLSSRCRMALRALRRWRCAPTAPCDPSPVVTARAEGDVGGLEKGVHFVDLQEHYEERSPTSLEVLETEAAIAAVLACSTYGDKAPHTDSRTKDVCGELAAEMLSTLCKASQCQHTLNSFLLLMRLLIFASPIAVRACSRSCMACSLAQPRGNVNTQTPMYCAVPGRGCIA